jgi:hypothetical protein
MSKPNPWDVLGNSFCSTVGENVGPIIILTSSLFTFQDVGSGLTNAA